MTLSHAHNTFNYEQYSFDEATGIASFHYNFDGSRNFTETLQFTTIHKDCDHDVLEAAMRLSFMLIGMSYFKLFPVKKVRFLNGALDTKAADFLNQVYPNGLSQFLFENQLSPSDLPVFEATTHPYKPQKYAGDGVIAMQSGGKDSLLTASLLDAQNIHYTPWYMQYGNDAYPEVLDMLSSAPRTIQRQIDRAALKAAKADGGLDGHVPITFMVMSFALIDAILHNENMVLVSIGAEGEEAHEHIGELAVNHQWSKTWDAEKLFANFVYENISSNLFVGSPLRALSELRIVQLFSDIAWPKYSHYFSSCNLANYQQGHARRTLTWDGTCPKCANAFLLFAPFIEPVELRSIIGGNLMAKPELVDTFKGLLGIDGVMKPFECIGETEELRYAYHWARTKWGSEAYQLPFVVPLSEFDYMHRGEQQAWTEHFLGINTDQ